MALSLESHTTLSTQTNSTNKETQDSEMQVACAKLADSLRKRCLSDPSTKADQKWLSSTVKSNIDCSTMSMPPEDQTLILAFRAEKEGGNSLLHSEGNRFVEKIRKIIFRWTQTKDIRPHPEYAQEIQRESSTFQNPKYRSTLHQLSVLIGGERSLDAKAWNELVLNLYMPLKAPVVPLENLCSQIKSRNGAYARTIKAELLSLIFALRASVEQNRFREKQSVASFSFEPLLPFLREIIAYDPHGVYQNELARLIIPIFRAQYPWPTYSGGSRASYPIDLESYSDLVNESDLFGLSSHLIGSLSGKLGNVGYLSNTRNSPYLLTRHLSEKRNFEVVIPGKCETGDDDSKAPVLGIRHNSELVPLDPKDGSWYYEVTPKSGEKSKLHNGLYDRKSVRYHAETDTTIVNVKIPRHEFEKGNGTANYTLKIRCELLDRWYHFKIPIQIESDPEDFKTQISRCETAPFDEFDVDGVRRGIFFLGPNIYPVNSTVELLKRRGFECVKESRSTRLAEDYLSLISQESTDQVDYVIHDSHSLGYEYDSDFFKTHREGTRYRCRRQETKMGKRVSNEVIILGYSPEQNLQDPKINKVVESISYNSFGEALKKSHRKTPLVMGRIACGSLEQCALILMQNRNEPLKLIPTQIGSKYSRDRLAPENDPADEDAGSALLLGMIEADRYCDMREKYSVFSRENILLPDHPDYKEKFIQGIGFIKSRTQVNGSIETPSVDKESITKYLKMNEVPLSTLVNLGREWDFYRSDFQIPSDAPLTTIGLPKTLADFLVAKDRDYHLQKRWERFLEEPDILSAQLGIMNRGLDLNLFQSLLEPHQLTKLIPTNLWFGFNFSGSDNDRLLFLLQKTGDRALPMLAALMNHGDDLVRDKAGWTLASMGKLDGVTADITYPPMFDMQNANNPSPALSTERNREEFDRFLVSLLEEANDFNPATLIRIAQVASLLESSASPKLVESLAKLLADDYPKIVKLPVLTAIKKMGAAGRPAFPQMLPLLDSTDNKLKVSTYEALGKIHGDPQTVLPKLFREIEGELAPGSLNDHEVRDLIDTLGDYASKGETQAIEALLNLRAGKNPGGHRLESRLTERQKYRVDSGLSVLPSSAFQFAPEIADSIILYGDENGKLSKGLVSIGEKTMPQFLKLLEDEDKLTAHGNTLAEVLGNLAKFQKNSIAALKPAKEILRRYSASSKEFQAALSIIKSLGRLGREAEPIILPYLHKPFPTGALVASTLLAIGGANASEAMRVLSQQIKENIDKSFGYEIQSALNLDGDKLVALFEGFLSDENFMKNPAYRLQNLLYGSDFGRIKVIHHLLERGDNQSITIALDAMRQLSYKTRTQEFDEELDYLFRNNSSLSIRAAESKGLLLPKPPSPLK